VTATEFQLRDKSKTYAISGKAGISTRGDTTTETGYYSQLGLNKNKGKLQFGISQNIYSDKYNPNDLGYLRRNNSMTTHSMVSYHIFDPFWIIREWHTNVWWDYTRMYNPNDIYSNIIAFDSYMLYKNNYSLELYGGIETNRHDYYETRVKGRYFYVPYYYWGEMYVNTDQRKPVNFYLHYGISYQPANRAPCYWGNASMNIRIGQHFQINYGLGFNNKINDWGFVDKTDNDDTIYFAKRDVKTFENVLETSYAFTNKASIRVRVRHYWSGAANKNYFQLQPDGLLKEDITYTQNKDENYNAFNIDMIFRWIFAPGSELSLAWKNSILNDQDVVTNNYWHNLDNTWSADQTNSLSLKILYYIDYNSLKRKK
jgi:hypothetical protein